MALTAMGSIATRGLPPLSLQRRSRAKGFTDCRRTLLAFEEKEIICLGSGGAAMPLRAFMGGQVKAMAFLEKWTKLSLRAARHLLDRGAGRASLG